MRLSKIAAGAAALVLSAGLLAGCGDKDDEKQADPTPSSSASEESANVALTKDNFSEIIGKAMTAARSVHVTMTSSGSLGLEAEGDQITGKTPADSRMSLTMKLSGMTMKMRMVDQVVYIDMGQVTQGKFAALDLTDTSNPLVAQFGQLAEQTDLAAQFEAFDAALTAFKKSGDAVEIDGVQAQPYRLTVDAKKLAKAQGQDDSLVPESARYVFYVGPDQLVRRLSVDVMGQGLQMDFTDWGKKVSIEKPKASEISDVNLAQLLSGAA